VENLAKCYLTLRVRIGKKAFVALRFAVKHCWRDGVVGWVVHPRSSWGTLARRLLLGRGDDFRSADNCWRGLDSGVGGSQHRRQGQQERQTRRTSLDLIIGIVCKSKRLIEGCEECGEQQTCGKRGTLG
jgi:hypothetical protein